ncbi:MAG: hypothetical protein C7B47_06775 [Sulfobacillus thermosulfidooxidans]|uniref:Uncharacterized protein n=1 Tax=Sulfobacillus thermosulfidooxidans TaxID=28034 RepID=A0A2T2X0G4_SULTH|nr:MAG: hypothetical protein C7B47_06775 [Sulfobacillus thermosulfidooxidans]
MLRPPLSVMVVMGSTILSTPTLFWALGTQRQLVRILHITSCLLMARLLFFVATFRPDRTSTFWAGIFSGIGGGHYADFLAS